MLLTLVSTYPSCLVSTSLSLKIMVVILVAVWNNRLVQNWERSTPRLYIVTCLFNFCEEYIMQNAWLDEAQAGIKIARRNINNLRDPDDTTIMEKAKK